MNYGTTNTQCNVVAPSFHAGCQEYVLLSTCMYIDNGSKETPGGGEKAGGREGEEEHQIEDYREHYGALKYHSLLWYFCTCTPSVQEKQRKGRGWECF